MNWYKDKKRKGLDVGVGVGIGLGLGLPLVNHLAPNEQSEPIPQVQTMPTSQPTEQSDIPSPQIIKEQENNYLDLAKNFVRQHEGVRNTAYLDTKNIPTIGIGFNLKRPDAKGLLEDMGLDYNSVLNKKQSLTNYQIEKLFEITLKEAEKIAYSNFKSFQEQPSEIKALLIDMSFNLGPKISNFARFRDAIDRKDYNKAKSEMINSEWYGQVKTRSKNLVNIINKYVPVA
jgi:GH24 family phage-related lysozyme (muramidase)